MNTQKELLTVRAATLNEVLSAIDQFLPGNSLERVELRYSMFSAETLIPGIAESELKRLLRLCGKDFIDVVVCALPLTEDHTTMHQLRLHYQAQGSASKFELAPGLPSCFKGILERCFTMPEPGVQVVSRPQPVANVSYAQALSLLRRAIAIAIADGETKMGSPLRVRYDAKGQVMARIVNSMKLVVRQGYLHQALAPLVMGEPERAKQLLTGMAQALGLAMAQGFGVDYEYRPWRIQGDAHGMALPTELDLQVDLQMCGANCVGM